MATGRHIDVLIDSVGNVEYETKGFSGKGCIEASAFLEEALGKVESTKKTAEYHKKPEIKQKLSNG